MTAIVPRDTAQQICAHRDEAIALYAGVFEAMKVAHKAHARATQIGGRTTVPFIAVDSNDRGWRQDEALKHITQNLDRDIWKGLIIGTPIGSLMDREERKKFEESVERDPPPATYDNVLATLERLLGEADMIFRRGLVNAFKNLNRDYASNDGFKIGDRIVITWGCSFDKSISWFRLNRGEWLQDIDRVMHVLDGKEAPEYSQGIQAAIEADMRLWNSRGERGKGEVTTSYWRAKYFKNGNLHLFPLRQDLLDRANRIIAEHYGMAVPARREVRDPTPDYHARPDANLETDFFGTPEWLAQDLVIAAEIEEGMSVLEPSAGEGGIARQILPYLGKRTDLTVIEIDANRYNKLLCELDFFNPAIADTDQPVALHRDFMEMEPEPRFDRIIMNPPFSQQQDVRHVMHALRFLRPGGRLISVMAGNAEHRQGKLSEAFIKTVERLGGTFEKLPARAFRDSGTDVNTVTLTIDLPAVAEQMAA